MSAVIVFVVGHGDVNIVIILIINNFVGFNLDKFLQKQSLRKGFGASVYRWTTLRWHL